MPPLHTPSDGAGLELVLEQPLERAGLQAGTDEMRTPVLQVRRLLPDAVLPARGHPSDAGLDLTAVSVEAMRPGVFAFDTALAIAISAGYYTEIVPRSSIVKTDFLLANSVGVIDPDYRGPLKVILRYLGRAADGGEAEAQALVGGRIAQLLVRRVEAVEVREAETLPDTVRGSGGFGSTGR